MSPCWPVLGTRAGNKQQVFLSAANEGLVVNPMRRCFVRRVRAVITSLLVQEVEDRLGLLHH